METTSILVVIEIISRYQYKWIDLKNRGLFAVCFFAFWVSTWNFQRSGKTEEPHISSISEVIDSELYAYLNA